VESTGEIPSLGLGMPSWSTSLLLGTREQRSTYPAAEEEPEHRYATLQRSAAIAALWDRTPLFRHGLV